MSKGQCRASPCCYTQVGSRHPIPSLPCREDAGLNLTSSPRRWRVPHPGAMPHHLQWALQCCVVLRVHQGARRALQHLTLCCCHCREPAGQGPGALGTFPALRGQPPAPCHSHHQGWRPPCQVRGEVTCCRPEQKGPACSPARTRFSSLAVWHHRTVLQPCAMAGDSGVGDIMQSLQHCCALHPAP